MKTCAKCHQKKELTEFSKDKSKKDRFQSCCKSCQKILNCHKKLIELLKYPYELPMNEVGDYDENVEWQKKVEQVLKEKE